MLEKKKYPNIDAERARNNLTVDQLTVQLGVSRKTYYNWCRAGRIPRDKLEAMGNIFGVSVDYLLGETAQR